MQSKENGDYEHDRSGRTESERLVSRMANTGEEPQVLGKGKILATGASWSVSLQDKSNDLSESALLWPV